MMDMKQASVAVICCLDVDCETLHMAYEPFRKKNIIV